MNARSRVLGTVRFFVLCCAGVTAASTYYVAPSPTGNDNASGSSSAPWATIQKGVDALSPGDILVVRAGTYQLRSRVYVNNKKGTQNAPILIQAQGRVVLNGGGTVPAVWQGLVDIRNSSWVTVQSFTLQESQFFGVYIEYSDHITVESCTTRTTNASGVASWWSSNITVRNNDVSDACKHGESTPIGSACQEHISLHDTQGFLVEGNRVHDSQQSGKAHWGGGEGIDIKAGSSNGIVRYNHVWNLVQLGLYIDAWDSDISNVEVYGNRSHNCNAGLRINAERNGNLSNIRVHDNLFYDNGWSGIELYRTVSGYCEIYNNTIVGNGKGENKPYYWRPDDWGFGIEIGSGATGFTIRDNIIWDNVTRGIEGNASINNNIIGPSGKVGTAGTNAIQSDPQFVNIAGRDLRLQSGSPAIDAGVGTQNLGTTDYWGNKRVSGAKVDIGAFEYGTAPPVAVCSHLRVHAMQGPRQVRKVRAIAGRPSHASKDLVVVDVRGRPVRDGARGVFEGIEIVVLR